MKLTAAIAASYFGAEVICAPYGGQPNRKIIGTMIGLNNHGIDIKFPEWQSPHQIAIDQCQLILTPLDKISDEDSYYIGKAFGDPSIGESGFARVGKYWASDVLPNDDPSRINFKPSAIRQITDYLRSKSYDIDNLIAAGVAVEKEIV